MSKQLLDDETILSENEEWTKLDHDWGTPIDLDTEDSCQTSNLKPVFSSLDLRKSTFDSSFLFKKIRRKVGRSLSKKSTSSMLNYKQFIQDLQREDYSEHSPKQFYYIGGEILSAESIENICDQIDDVFKSVEKLCSATSTVRKKKVPKIPEFVQCSISITDLSFDDTAEDLEREKNDDDDVDRFIDEVFDQINFTMASMSVLEDDEEETGKETVTALVKKFSNLLKSPAIKCSPRKQKQCCVRFKDLAEFWNSQAVSREE